MGPQGLITADTHPTELSRNELEELKRERLHYTVEYAYEHSPFYRESMDEHGVEPEEIQTFEDLEQLPVVTGQEIRDNQPPTTDSHRFRTQVGELHRPFATSGSTGPPKMVYHSYDEIDSMKEMYYRALQYFGVETDGMLLTWAPCVGLNASGFIAENTHNEYGYPTLPLYHSDIGIDQQYHFIKSHDVSGIVGLPSQIHARTHRFNEAGYDTTSFGIDYLVVAGEPLSDKKRAQLEQFYDADVYPMIATTESMIHGAECQSGDGLHVMADRVHTEIVDDNGDLVSHGEQGQMTITNLLAPGEHSSMPLIRYQPNDITRHLDDCCGCEWSEYPRISQPHRAGWEFNFGAVVLDVLYFEEVIHGHPAIEDDVTDYQLYLDYEGTYDKERLEVRIVTRHDAHHGESVTDVTIDETPNVAAEVGQSLLQKRSTVHETVDIVDAAQIDVRFVEDIEHSKGKPDRLIDNR